MRVIDLALKDILQIIRDKNTLLFLIAMPIVFTLFFGWIFGGNGEDEDARLPVGIVDQDAGYGALSVQLIALLEQFGVSVNSDWIHGVNEARKHLNDTKSAY